MIKQTLSSINWKKIYPHLIALFVFIVVTLTFFYPMLEGKRLRQSDVKQWEGMSKEIMDYKENEGDEVLWTGSMFSGMPAYQIHTFDHNPLRFIIKLLRIGMTNPARFLFLYFLGFYVLLVVLRVNPWLAMTGAIAFGFSTYFIIILAVGHITKAHAIGYMPFVIAGTYLLYKRKYIAGGLLAVLFLSLHIMANHYQISYYLLITLAIIAIAEFIYAVRKKELKPFFISTGLLALIGIIAVMANINKIYTTYDYTSETTRGKSELTLKAENKTSGLDKDYITGWSYGIEETLTLLIPNAKGGGDAPISENKSALEKVDRNYREIVGQFNHYWGNQPFTAGPVYVGAIVFFLFILSMFLLKGPFKWAMIAVTILSIMLAWGKNFMFLTEIFIDFLPGYSKFRTVSMALVIAELTIPLMAFMGLQKIISDPGILKKTMKGFWISLVLSGGVVLILLALPDTFLSFIKADEAGIFANWQNTGATADQIAIVKANLADARIAIFRADATRSLLFILAGAGLLYLYSIKKLNKTWLFAGLFVFIIADLFTINRRYLDSDEFVKKSRIEAGQTPSGADKAILEDTDPNFRVLNISVSTFNDASTSYFHKSIGGYHGAKLGRYQELIEYHLAPEISDLRSRLSGGTFDEVSDVFRDLGVLNMLNTKYIIFNPDSRPLVNPYRFGNCWPVESIRFVGNANEEILTLGDIDLSKEALVDQRFKELLQGFEPGGQLTGSINLTSYHPEKLVYTSNLDSDALVVFSEIYYHEGWNAYLDGEEVPYLRANYLLRAMIVPAGKHDIEFRFEPREYYTTRIISYTFGYLILAAIIIAIAAGLNRWRKRGMDQIES